MNISVAKERLKEWWYGNSANERSSQIKTFVITGLVLVLFGFYYWNHRGDDSKDLAPPPPAEPIPATTFLDRDIDARIAETVQKEVARQLAAGQPAPVSDNPSTNNDGLDDLGMGDTSVDDDLEKLNFDNNQGQSTASFPASPNSYTPAPAQAPVQQAPALLGGIDNAIVNDGLKQPAATTPQSAEKKFPIPPGWMPAMLLVGVHAQVSQKGSDNPKPVHLRVQAPATLPNKIKMNLTGCIVIANTWGNLASERIEGETVSLSCMTSDKKTLVQGKLIGYLADKDGQRDLAGRVVTKASALIGRQVIADTFNGIGSSINQNTGEVAISPLGSVTSITPKEAAQRGVAAGVGSGFKHAADYIGELIAQSGPVIESGAAREVMIMVQETSWLEVKNIDTMQPTINGETNPRG